MKNIVISVSQIIMNKDTSVAKRLKLQLNISKELFNKYM